MIRIENANKDVIEILSYKLERDYEKLTKRITKK